MANDFEVHLATVTVARSKLLLEEAQKSVNQAQGIKFCVRLIKVLWLFSLEYSFCSSVHSKLQLSSASSHVETVGTSSSIICTLIYAGSKGHIQTTSAFQLFVGSGWSRRIIGHRAFMRSVVYKIINRTMRDMKLGCCRFSPLYWSVPYQHDR